jgi:hypothetical protein
VEKRATQGARPALRFGLPKSILILVAYLLLNIKKKKTKKKIKKIK